MDTIQILSDLRAERDRIDQAIAALQALDSTGVTAPRRGRPPAAMTQGAAPKPSGRRRMSLAARKRISEAAKKRWAQRKGMSSKPQGSPRQAAAPKKVALKRVKGGISAAGRKRISEMMKKRWAERKRAAKTA